MTHVHHHHHTHQHHHVGLTHIGGIHETIVSTTRQDIVPQRRTTSTSSSQVFATRAASRRPAYSLIKCIKCGRVQDALNIIIEHSTLPAHVLIPAIRRSHRELFERVLGKVDGFDPRVVDALINAPHMFTNICLRAGLNINAWRARNGDDLATFLSRRYKTKHLKHVLSWEALQLSKAAIDMVLSDDYQKREFTSLLFARGMPARKEHALDALKNNDSTTLGHILETLQKADNKWNDIVELLTCPITQEITADLVQTPSRHLYDREALVNWIKQNQSCPLTRAELYIDDLKERDDILPDIIQRIKRL